ncbi:ULA1-like protein [Saccharomyces kudriavzevii IFO 1802]|uniref:NEDD8-activating enzyme E1 regulatory subunit n=2 Tax=Saccharomyces kudriavzevii (strain ATCC MYA-4449 / AS 2.2408 / CBS 8840 / NBRC 1802 / NCYC 2889) TaxID=226230 RepID=J6EEK6_SACK1|nr:ULA1-like protein [Saccharomyces kudriavzevii IFO 1802]
MQPKRSTPREDFIFSFLNPAVEVAVDEDMERYDRQLRLWGPLGQDRLNRSCVCLIGPVTPLLQEVSKNLVLAGVSSFTWLKENSAVPSGPLFLAELKKDLEPLTSKLLVYEEKDLGEILEQLQYDWSRFSVIILICIGKQNTLLDLNEIKRGIGTKFPPVLNTSVSGLYGYVNLVLSEAHFVLRAHPDSKKYDLRLQNPWPELVEYVKTFDLTRMDVVEFSGIPYIVLLIKCIAKLKKDGNSGKLTSGQVKDTLSQICLSLGEGAACESNYAEARRYAYLACSRDDCYQELDDLLRNLEISDDEHDWHDICNYEIVTLVLALKRMAQESEESTFQPLAGALPDMESTTVNYTELKSIYEVKAEFDRSCVKKSLVSSGKKVSKGVLNTFCSHYGEVRGILPSESDLLGIFSTSNTLLSALVMRQFQKQYTSVECENEFIGLEIDGNYSIMAFFGGVVAQEAIKLITHHFIPIDNLFLYNGIDNSSATYKI